MAHCYLSLEHYEDALETSKRALLINPHHEIVLWRKARALAFLFQFHESIEIFTKLKRQSEIDNVNSIRN